MNKYYSLSSLFLLVCILHLQSQTSNAPEGMALIPGGTYMMGSNMSNHMAFPKHPVTLDSFYMDIHEVTNKQYYEFCMADGHKFPEFWNMDIYKSGLRYPEHPVIGVSQSEAHEYAKWAGKRLPTEAEWEYAARCGLEDISYYFGDKADHSLARYNDPEAEKGPVKTGSFSPNAFGLYDMSGNVWEWVSDWFHEDYYKESPEKNPPGPASGRFKVFRGGGWHSGGGCITVDKRNALPSFWVDLAGGFRCVMDIKP